MAEVQHQVWATDPETNKRELISSFPPYRWQWAEKLYQYLLDKGFQNVEVRDVSVKAKK